MMKKTLISVAMLLPSLAFAQGHAYGHWHRWCAPEIDGGVAVLGLAILGGMLAFMKNRAR
jgi:hypothetical protein